MIFNSKGRQTFFICILFATLISSCQKSITNDTDSNTDTTTEKSTISLYKIGSGVTDIDGNFYPSIIIGNQEWMQINLKVTRYQNGDSIVTHSSPAGLWNYYNNDPSYNTPYGKLYSWAVAADSRIVAPIGWHIPAAYEWDTLINRTGGPDSAGRVLKENGYSHWIPGGEDSANNKSGFTGLPGGECSMGITAQYGTIGSEGYWWTTSITTNNEAIAYNMGCNTFEVDPMNSPKIDEYSIRCIKN